MLNTLSQPQQPIEPDDEGFPVDWELTTTVTRSPVPIIEACDSGEVTAARAPAHRPVSRADPTRGGAGTHAVSAPPRTSRRDTG